MRFRSITDSEAETVEIDMDESLPFHIGKDYFEVYLIGLKKLAWLSILEKSDGGEI
jgi:hypothetical protein